MVGRRSILALAILGFAVVGIAYGLSSTTAIRVVYPNGGESLHGTIPINVTDIDASKYGVDLYYYNVSNSEHTLIEENVTSFPYNWNTGSLSGYFKIKAVNHSDPSEYDYSNDTFTIDNTPPSSSVNPISPYWNTTGNVTITATASDTLSGLKNVSLYYYYSADNSTWEGPCLFGTNETPWVGISWNFTFPNGTGYYRFYSIAIDNASNVEEFDGNDTMCGFDNTAPKPVILIPVDGAYYNSLDNISGYATDELSGIEMVYIAIYNSTDGTGWIWSSPNGSWVSGSGGFYYTHLNTSSGALNVTWWYVESWIPTWADGKVYKVKCKVYDLAGNVNYTEVNFTYDTKEPQSFIKGETVAPPYWHNASITISVTAQDYGTHASGVSNVTLWYRYRPDNSSSWGNWTYFEKNESGTDHIWNFTFDFPSGEGHYQFYSVANDTAGNTETVDVANMTNIAECGYDRTSPNVTIIFPENGNFYNTRILIINGTASDELSGIKDVSICIYNFSSLVPDGLDGGDGGGGEIWWWNFTAGKWDNSTPIYYYIAEYSDGYWYLDNETAPSWPTWVTGTLYLVDTWVDDNAGNSNRSYVYSIFGYDTTPPTSWIEAIEGDYWHGNETIAIIANANDTELYEWEMNDYLNLSLYYRYRANNESDWSEWILYGYGEPSESWVFEFTPKKGDGFYQFYTIAIDLAGNVENKTDPDPNGSIGVDTTAPEITLIKPTEGSFYADIDNITGTATDATSGVDTVYVAIYSYYYGLWWNVTTGDWSDEEPYLIQATIENNSWYLNQNLPDWENAQKYMVLVLAIDVAGNEKFITANFTILSLHLYEGWNLVSVPRELESASIEAVFEGITTITRVYYYDPISGWKWAFYNNETESWDTSGGLTTIDDGKGYWIYATAEISVALTLKEIDPVNTTPPTYPVKAGWNLIGYTTLSLETSTPIYAYLQNLYNGYFEPLWVKLYRYTPGIGYEMATPWYTDYFDTFDLTRGYWLYCSEDGEIVP